MQGGVPYGPARPEPTCGYQHFTTPRALTGYASKILKDLVKVARLYNGREARLYNVNKGERCTKCTNMATGERMLTNCPVCHGTGYTRAWDCLGDYWTLIDFGPHYNIATPQGNTENPNGGKDQIYIFGAPELGDQSLVIFLESREVFKVYDVHPHIVAMRGTVIVQIASCTRVTPGSEEYDLIDW